MADGRNEARALRILEIVSEFRTQQININALVTQRGAQAPDAASQALLGYTLVRQCAAEAQRILAQNYDDSNLGFRPGQVPATEAQRTALQRIILDVYTRRFMAHRVYLRAAAATRWIQARAQTLQGQPAEPRHATMLTAIDQRLRQELAALNDQHILTELRRADTARNYWIVEDPSLERIVAWARQQR